MEKRDFFTTLKEKIVDKVISGKQHFVIWGFTATSIRLLSDLNGMGLLNKVTGIVDSDPVKQGQKIFHLSVSSPYEIKNLTMEVLVIASDENKESILNDFIKVDNRVPEVILSGSKHYVHNNPLFEKIVKSMPVRSIAAGYPNMLIHIFQSLEYLVKNGLNGAVAEFGVFQGGTLGIIAKTLRTLGWKGKIYGFDLFDKEVSKRSVLDVFTTVKYSPDYETVRKYCEPYGVELVQGDIYETYKLLKNVPLMFSFFDTDFYSPTRVALELCYNQTVKGGILAFDHYYSEGWEETIGERIAAKEVLGDKPVFHLNGTGIFMKL